MLHLERCECTQIYDGVGNVIICSKSTADHIMRQCRERDICSVYEWVEWQKTLSEDDSEYLLDDYATPYTPWN